MADTGIKKARVPISELPPINSNTEGYSIRYRIISDDKNRISAWSPIYLIQPQYTFVPEQISFNSANQVASVVWDAVTVIKDNTTSQTIINKELSSDLATLTTSVAHYMNVGDWVTVSGVDGTFNGTYQISAITNTSFSYYKNAGNVGSTVVSPNGTYNFNEVITKPLEYDIWVRWDRNDGGDWIYKETIASTSISFPHPQFYTINGAVQPSSPNKFSIEIYLRGYPVQRGDGVVGDPGTPFLKVYEVLNETI